jgi:hypothetical protein
MSLNDKHRKWYLPWSNPSEPAEKLLDGHDSDSVATGHLDEIDVAFEIVVPGYEILRFPMDSRLQDFVVIGIAADIQHSRRLNYRGAGGDQANKSVRLAQCVLESAR